MVTFLVVSSVTSPFKKLFVIIQKVTYFGINLVPSSDFSARMCREEVFMFLSSVAYELRQLSILLGPVLEGTSIW
jgi:hypothetical protein